MEDISIKEWFISIAVAVMAIAIAVFINPFVQDGFLQEAKLAKTALQVNNNAEQFQYAAKTQVGNVLAFGDIEAYNPVTLPELNDYFGAIEKITEEYTMHTRQNCTTDSKGKETCTTEVYWEWDVTDRDYSYSPVFVFLGVSFDRNSLDLSPQNRLELNEKTISSSYKGKTSGNYLYPGSTMGNTRYSYRVLPIKFAVTIFCRFMNNTVSNPVGNSPIPVFYNETIEQTIEHYENQAKMFNVFYYVVVISLIVGGYFVWAYQVGNVE